MENISVRLIDAETGNAVKNTSGENIETVTNNRGIYLLEEVPTGRYLIIFDYDESLYSLTYYKKDGVAENYNSDVIKKTLNINGVEDEYSVSDFITVTDENISSINMGLIELEDFNLKLDKYVEKITVVQNGKTAVYSYDNSSLAKIELDRKNIEGAVVTIEYNISVTNIGELEGYVKSISDYLPNDVDFSTETNKDWIKQGNNIISDSLSNTVIKSGETKSIPLTITKKLTATNTGVITNIAEITEDYNDLLVQDSNSTPGNQKQGEDDMGKAEVIVSVKTGAFVYYLSIFTIIIVLFGIAIFIYYKKIRNKNI